MAEVASAFVSILPSARGFGRSLDSQISGDIDSSGKKAGTRFGGAMKAGLIGVAAGIGIGAAKIIGDSISAASNAQQAVGGVEAVFGKYADGVLRDSKKAAQGLGLSSTAYDELITVSGALLKNKGIEDFAKQSKNLIGVGADLSATFGGSTKDAVDALNAAMRGESDPIERYGVSLNETAVNAVLAADGQDKLKGKALEQAKAQARLKLITDQTKDSQGAFARESGTLAGQQQRLTAQWDNLKVAIGERLLPVLTTIVEFANTRLLPALSNMGDTIDSIKRFFQPVIAAVGAFIDSFKGTGRAGELMQTAKDAIKGALDSVKSIFKSVTSIVTTIWKRFGNDIVRFISTSLRNGLQVVRGIFKVLEGIFKTVAAVLKGDWQGAWDGIKLIVSGAKDIIVGSVKQFWNALKTAFRVGVKAAKSIVDGLWEGIKNGASNLAGAMLEAGKDLVRGLINGIKSMASAAANAAADVVKGAIDKAKGALKIGSPSKVFHQIGAWTGEGFVNGMREKSAAVRESGRKVAEDVLQGWKDRSKELRDGVLQTGKDVAASVSQAFTPSGLFSGVGELGVTALDQFRESIAKWKTDLVSAQGAISSLMSQGIGGQFLQQLASSGNTALLVELAGSGQALQFQSEFASLTSQAATIGSSVGEVAMTEGFASVVTELQVLGDRIEAAESANALTIGVVVGGASVQGHRDRRNRGNRR